MGVEVSLWTAPPSGDTAPITFDGYRDVRLAVPEHAGPERGAEVDVRVAIHVLNAGAFATGGDERPARSSMEARSRRDAARQDPPGLLEVLLGASHLARLLHHLAPHRPLTVTA